MSHCVLFLALIVHPVMSSPLVNTPFGTLKGTTSLSKSGKPYNSFRGIPFAKPPIGDLRFRAPVPADPLDGVYAATEFKPYCVQINVVPSEFGLGQEDCLYLNIYSPQDYRESDELKKVYFFIHGGGNMNGFSDLLTPATLVTEYDIIVVAPNYRLGYLGFLSTLSPGCEGNFGLKDQLLALSWVKDNIKSFGGDSNDITIGGMSAGGTDASLLAIVPQARDLFTKAFLQSGVTGVQYTILIKDPRPFAISTAKKFGCIENGHDDPTTEEDLDLMVECLRKLPASTFSLNTFAEPPNVGPVLYGNLFLKNVQDLFADEEYLESIHFFKKQFLVSLTENEGAVFDVMQNKILSFQPEEHKQFFSAQFLLRNNIKMITSLYFGSISQTVVEKIANYYNNNYEVSPTADCTGDALFYIPSIQYAKAIARKKSSAESKIHLLHFVHQPGWMTGPYRGMVHTCDLYYLSDLDPDFGNKIIDLQMDSSKWTEEDDHLRHKFISVVVDFIKTGKPAKSLPSGFPAYDVQEQAYLQFGLTSEVKHGFKTGREELWMKVIPEWIKQFPIENEIKDEL